MARRTTNSSSPTHTTCALCRHKAPSASLTIVEGAPLGPTCAKRIVKRLALRSLGTELVLHPEPGRSYTTSIESRRICGNSEDPAEQTHCLDCPNAIDPKCPLERAQL